MSPVWKEIHLLLHVHERLPRILLVLCDTCCTLALGRPGAVADPQQLLRPCAFEPLQSHGSCSCSRRPGFTPRQDIEHVCQAAIRRAARSGGGQPSFSRDAMHSRRHCQGRDLFAGAWNLALRLTSSAFGRKASEATSQLEKQEGTSTSKRWTLVRVCGKNVTQQNLSLRFTKSQLTQNTSASLEPCQQRVA